MNIKKDFKETDKKIKKADKIFIMGHSNLDLDAIGSSLALYNLYTNKNKDCFLIIDEEKHELAVDKIINELKDEIKILTSKDVLKKITELSLLIIVDTNNSVILQNTDITKRFKNIIVIDHHEENENTIENSLKIINPDFSSTSEMISRYMYEKNLKVDSSTASYLLGGIVLDTNNFVLKTSSNTYLMAYFLTTMGANPLAVEKLMKQDIVEYIRRQKIITNMEIIDNTKALAICPEERIYRREDLAKIADTLLQFDNIEESYVIGNIDTNTVGISARSLGKVNIGEKMQKISGGGNRTEAAAIFKDQNQEEVFNKLISLIK
ncbi:MAG: DHH family phosphoesterase [Bacilli bacterium]|nr:DHH family phosphoesterase [Bacilli bacterium]